MEPGGGRLLWLADRSVVEWEWIMEPPLHPPDHEKSQFVDRTVNRGSAKMCAVCAPRNGERRRNGPTSSRELATNRLK